MRVLFSTPAYKPAWKVGGPVHSVSRLAEELVARGHEVVVATSNANLEEDLDVPTDRFVDVDGVLVRYFCRSEPLKKAFPRLGYVSKSLGVVYTAGMASCLAQLVPTVDIVHTHLPFVYPTYAAARAAVRNRKPLVYHQRGVFDSERLRFRSMKKKLYLGAIEMPILRKASMLIALTESERASYRHLGLSNPCRVIPNGIDTDRFEAPADVSLLRALGISTDDLVVLFLGRIHPIKGADRLLEAFLLMQHRAPSAKLVLAGPDEFGLQGSFRSRAYGAGLDRRVLFPGMIVGDLKTSLLARADLFVLPSDGEGFSMAVLEALASSTAVLLSPGCHFEEVVAAGAGAVCPSEPIALAQSLEAMTADREALRSMGEAGKRLVNERFSWARVADEMVAAYQAARDDSRTRDRGMA